MTVSYLVNMKRPRQGQLSVFQDGVWVGGCRVVVVQVIAEGFICCICEVVFYLSTRSFVR